MDKIKYIILISGKRKCGKDFISEKLQKKLGSQSEIIHISAPIKSEWAKKLQLDLDNLLGDGPYKERYRKDMIEWSDQIRAKDYGYFCRTALGDVSSEIVIVSDIRRRSDIRYFDEILGARVKKIRLTCPDAIRAERGWKYITGIDDVKSECDLDQYDQWDLVLENNNAANIEAVVDRIISKLELL